VSGCGCGQPVVFNNPAASQRLDVETLVMCDVLPDGTVAALVAVEPVYDASTGQRVATRTVDPVTGEAYTVQGELTQCPTEGGCDSHTELLCDAPAGGGEPVRFLRRYSYDCATGEPDGHTDLTLDGTPYTVTGTVGVCTPPQCAGCETLQLCDVLSATTGPQGVIAPAENAGSGTASSGVSWSVTGDGNNGPMELEANVASADGTGYWYGIQTYPRDSAGPQTWEFGQPSTVQFSVVQVGPGSVTFSTDVIPLHLPEGYSYDAATRTLSSTSDDCPSLRTPAVATSATFLTAAPVSSMVITTPQAVPICGQVGATRVGGFVLNPGPVPFLRTLCRDCATGETTVTDTTLDGTTAYQVLGTTGACETPPGTDCEIVQLCDVQHQVPAVLPSFGTPDEQWQTLAANGVRWMKRGLDMASGDGWYLAADNAPERFDFDRPVSIRYTVRFSGPTATPLRIPAGWYLDSINTVQHTWNAATRTISPTASATQVGESVFKTDALTAQTMFAPVLTGAQTAGQTSQYGQITVAADVAVPFLRTLCRDAGGVTTADTTLDGVTLYEVQGEAGTCPEPPSTSSPCADCETLILCDSGSPATITGTAAQGTLANGVAYTARNPGPLSTGTAMPARIANSDGIAFWGLHSFPNLADAPTRWTFSLPSVVEFSVYLIGSPTNPPSNQAQLPVGLEVLSLPENYTYDPATGVLTRTWDGTTDSCTYVTDPQPEHMARFRTPGPVTSLTTQPGQGSRIAACTTFFTYYVGAFSVAPGGQFLRRICRDCDGQVTSVTDTLMDGVTPYVPVGDVGQCQQEPPCDLSVVEECTYSMPDGAVGFDLNSASYPDCMLATATNPRYGYGDRVTAWEGTYESSTGAISAFGFTSGDLGGDINWAAFNPAIPIHPTQSPAGYVGTATFNGVVVTLRALAGNGVARNDDPTKLNVDNGDRYRIEFSKPVRLTLTTTGFGDPPAPHFERFCGVVVDTVPWPAVKLADCQGRIKVVDAVTGSAIPARATLTCGDNCCQPVQVCIQQIPTQTREFISNEAHRNDNTVDPVWKWTTDLNAASPVWYDMYQFQFSADWTVRDSDTARPAWWVSPHPDGRSAQSSPPRPNEGPSLLNVHWYPRAFFDLPDNADPSSIRVQATVFNADQAGRAFRLNDGAWQTLPASATHNGTTYTFGPDAIPGAKAGRNALYLDVEETVGGGAGLMVHLKVFYQVIPETRSWTRMVCCDDSIYYLDEDGQRQDAPPDGWRVAPCFLPPSSANG
jgi:hypothetical protein